MNKLELQLVSTNELAEEMASRFDDFVLHGIQKDPKNNNRSIYYDHWKGDTATLIGLCEIIKDKISANGKNNTTDI